MVEEKNTPKKISMKRYKEAKDAKKPFEGSPRDYINREIDSENLRNRIAQEEFESARSFHYNSAKMAEKRVEELFKTAKKEAAGLNNEYDKKREKFREEIASFSKFGINELGMNEAQLREVFKDEVDSVFEDIIDDVNLEDAVKKENKREHLMRFYYRAVIQL